MQKPPALAAFLKVHQGALIGAGMEGDAPADPALEHIDPVHRPRITAAVRRDLGGSHAHSDLNLSRVGAAGGRHLDQDALFRRKRWRRWPLQPWSVISAPW